jgi:hypothetical protein
MGAPSRYRVDRARTVIDHTRASASIVFIAWRMAV